MIEPYLFAELDPAKPAKRRPTVRQTSKLAVTEQRDSGRLQQRAGDICHWLSWHQNATGEYPTTAELAVWVAYMGPRTAHDGRGHALARFGRLDPTAQRNYVAKGLWDAQQAVMVEAVPNSERKCSVGGRKAITWRLRSL